MMHGVFITGTDTGVGTTRIGVALPDRQRAMTVPRSGLLLAFRADRIYRPDADACHPEGVIRIVSAKGSLPDHSFIVHLADASRLSQWARRSARKAWQLAEAFWSGPLTLFYRVRRW